MTPDESSSASISAEGPTLLNEDAFQNDHSRGMFEAIDEMRSCGANRDIELPEVRRYGHCRTNFILTCAARYHWGSVRGKVLALAKPNGNSLSCRWSFMYQVPHPYHFSEDLWTPRGNKSLHRS